MHMRGGAKTKNKVLSMALGVTLISGFIGFVTAIASGLLLGLGFAAAFAVYAGVGTLTAVSLFAIRGLWCAAARSLA